MFMAATFNPPKTPFKINLTPTLPPPPTSCALTFKPNNNFPHSPPPHNHNNKNTPLCSTLFSIAHARTKCSNPSEPPPPLTASPKQIFTIRFLPTPPKPGERVHLIESLPQFPSRDRFCVLILYPCSLYELFTWCLTRQACDDLREPSCGGGVSLLEIIA
ncbi:hypothetical protein HN51_063586 [Arachis hypogaea]